LSEATDSATPPVFVLEACDESLDAVLPPLREAFEVCLLHAPRRADPRHYGCALERGHWLVGPPEAPDPYALFNVLEALEALLIGTARGRPFLVGSGGGATLALATASCWGDRLRAVVAVGGRLPALPAGVVRARIEGLPILWHPDPQSGSSVGAASLEALVSRGAVVSTVAPAGLEEIPDSLVAWLRARIGS
jgi:pimeloyl-ACP methyl ester carboxylesterase